MKIKTVKQMDVQDWDSLVESTYKKPYSFQQQDGCKPRGVETISTGSDWAEDYETETIPEVTNGEEMGVSFKAWLAKDPNAPLNPSDTELKECSYYWGKTDEDKEDWKTDKWRIRMFWERNFYPHVSMIAQDLCRRGLLEPGEYQIKIDW
jgi:hypothetical protein